MTNPQTESQENYFKKKLEKIKSLSEKLTLLTPKTKQEIDAIIYAIQTESTWGINDQQQLIKAADTAREDERNYYQERYAFNRDEAFSNFCKMLTGVLIHKTSPGLIQAIVEDVTTEYRKIYYPEAIQQDTKE